MAIRDYEAEHRAVLDEALQIHIEKSQVRGQLWLTMPPSDKIRELDERVNRIQVAYAAREQVIPPEQGPEFPQAPFERAIIEDALDILNYAVFLIRQIRAGEHG